MTKKAKKLLTGYALVMPAFLLVMLIVAYPIVNAVIRSFTVAGQKGFTLANYQYFFTDKWALQNLFYTIYVVVVTVVITIVVAYLLAMFLRFSKSKISKVIGVLYLLPRFIPGLVAVYAMIMVIRDSGLLNRIGLTFGVNFKPDLMFTAKGMILMNLWFNIPFAALIIASSLGSIQDPIIESAKDVGASKWNVFKTMILPLSFKDVMIAAAFVFMSNVGSFTTPYLMGGNNPKMLGIFLFEQFNKYLDYEKAAALSVIMFLICSVSAVVYIYTNLREKEWEK